MKTTKLILQTSAIVIMIFYCIQANAQTVNWPWLTQTAGMGDERILNLDTDPQGNVYFGGTMNDDFIFEGNAITGFGSLFDGLVARYSPSGSQNWAISIGGSSFLLSSARSISTVPDGNILFIANASFGGSPGDTVHIGTNHYEIFNGGPSMNVVIKMDSLGNVIWSNKIFDPNNQGSASNLRLDTDTDGNFYVGGYMQGSLTFDTITVNPIGTDATFLAKGDASGNFIWAKSFGCNGNEGQLIEIKLNEQNEIFLSGGWEGDTLFIDGLNLINPTPGGFFNSDRFICKFDTAGTALWLVREGGIDGDSPAKMVPSADGGVACFSNVYDGTSITINQGLITITGNAVLITRYDAQGNFKSYFNYTTTASGYGFTGDGTDYYISLNYSDPQLTIGGVTLSNSGGTSGTNDAAIAKIDTSWNVIWVVNIGANEDEFVWDIQYSPIAGLVIGGTTASAQLMIGNHTINNTGLLTIESFVTALDYIVGIEGNEISDNISLYPNPAKDVIYLNFNDVTYSSAQLTVVNAIGQVVLTKTVQNNGSAQIDITDLVPGFYMLKIETNENYGIKKFMKE